MRSPGLLLFYGEEDYLIREALDQAVDEALQGALRDFNLDVFYAQVDETSRVRDAVETLPMMADKRVVVLKEAQHLRAKDYESLLPVIESPVESTVFILVATHIDQRLKFYKKFSENGKSVKFTRPYENQISGWVDKIASRNKLRLQSDANELLQRVVGTSLIDIDNELKKLSQYLGVRAEAGAVTEATVEDVKAVVSTLRTDTVFQLANAIGAGDRSLALTCLANLLEHGESPLGILALVSRHIRILTHVRDGMEEGLSYGQLSSKVGVPSFFMKQYVDQSRSWNESKIRQTYRALMQTDRALKSSPLTPHIWLENLVLNICG
jgi:DNA polymerase-3 subunit delta